MKTVFIIEDEIIVAKDIEQTLIRAGYTVVGIASTYNKAIKKISSTPPDLILCDINLEGDKDGIDLITEIQQIMSVPFIFISAYTDAATKRRAEQLPLSNYLTKPYSESQLLSSVHSALTTVN